LGVRNCRVPVIGPAGTFPDIEQYWLPMQCQQCENPGCIAVCPTGASYRNSEDGVVLIDETLCIGCQACLTGCPFDVRTLNKDTNTVFKCTLCHQNHNDANWTPVCVADCCTGARIFGDLDDPNSAVSQAVAAAGDNAHQLNNPNGVGPSTYYILSPNIAAWTGEHEGVTRLGY
jgi:Fe-S-cluster-containing dehydrogenase component